MGFPSALTASTSPRVSVARIPEGNTLPTAYVIDSDNVAAAGAASLTLSLNTVGGAAAGGNDSVDIEHDALLLMPSSGTIAVDGSTFTTGTFVVEVDDGSDDVPTDLIAAGDYFTIDADTTLYRVISRAGISGGYQLRVFPELAATPADNAAVTVYNQVRLNLASGVQFATITSTGAAFSVTGVTYAMAGPASSRDVYETRQLIGIESSSPTTSVETTDVATNSLTTVLKGTTTLEVAVEGIRIPGDAANREILMPFLLPQGTVNRSAESLWARYESSDGSYVVEGPGSITEADGGETINEAATYSYTLSINVGDDLKYWLR